MIVVSGKIGTFGMEIAFLISTMESSVNRIFTIQFEDNGPRVPVDR